LTHSKWGVYSRYHALYDVITGKVVMEHIDDCVSTGSSLYVWDGETKTFTRYIAEFKSLQ